MDYGKLVTIYLACIIAFVRGECVYSPTYNGTLNVTLNGYTCQRWDSNYPHGNIFNESYHFPNDGSVYDAHNYCRTPQGTHESPWCLTTDESILDDWCVKEEETCKEPEYDESACYDLPDHQNSTNCPNNTEYYVCIWNTRYPGDLVSILYDLPCIKYKCCNASSFKQTTVSTLATTSIKDFHDQTTKMTSPNEDSSRIPPSLRERTTPMSSCECLMSKFHVDQLIFLSSIVLFYFQY